MKQEYTISTWDRDRWPNFSFDEVKCSHTGFCFIDPDVMDKLQEIRYEVGPITISSAYRAAAHPAEAKKVRPGSHPTGKAFDIVCCLGEAHDILYWAMRLGFTGIGVKQHGPMDKRFLHLDFIETEDNFHAPRPTLWSY